MLIVSGPGGDARRYRGDHRREQLDLAGIETDLCYRSDVELAPLAERYGCVILYRVPMDADVARLIDSAAGRVVCDFDDLVFDPGAASWIRGLDALNREERASFVAAMEGQREALCACGVGTFSTAPLATQAAGLAERTAVMHNVVNATMVEQAAAARASRTRDADVVRIGYLSGTPTHDRDFLESADAVLACLRRRRDTRLVVAGFLRLDERFDAYADRVERVEYQPWQRLPSLLATLDISLAPLERDNPFTEGKSCLKFLEAALVGVPTVASARRDFARVVDHGVNGLLADSPEKWDESLARLIDEPELRHGLGDRARDDVLSSHTTEATAFAARDALAGLVPSFSDALGKSASRSRTG
jgi:glycosyltransferase involved in cell wall biosynthesis